MAQDGLVQGIADACAKRQLVIVCGAGTSLGATADDPRAGWSGFIDHGISWCERNDITFQGDKGRERARADLADGDLISAADKVQRALTQAGQWTNFLQASFSDLPLADPSLLVELGAFGTPIATTNYDTLLERALDGIPSVHWRSKSFLKALRDPSVGIAHIHGVWTEPETVIFGSGSYGGLAENSGFQALEFAMGVRATMLFVGVGQGLDDPNLGSLIRRLEDEFKDTGIVHYRLLTSGDASHVPSSSVVRPVIFGDDPRTDLLPFVRHLLECCGRSTNDKREPVVQDLNELLATPLLRSHDGAGPTLRNLWPDLLIEPRVRPRRDLGSQEVAVTDWLADHPLPRSVVVIGGPGAGKSTTLRKIVLSGTRGDSSWAFVTAQELAGVLAIDDDAIAPTLVVDGIDELGGDDLRNVATLLRPLVNRRWWISCRSEFFSRATQARPLLESAEEVLEVRPLSEDSISWFIDQYVAKTGSREVGELMSKWRQTPAFSSLLTVPLNLTLALFLAAGRRTADVEEGPPQTRFELYRDFYNHWLLYEGDRSRLSSRDRRWVRDRHTAVARLLYLQRQGNRPVTPRMLLGNASPRARTLRILLVIAGEPSRPVAKRFSHDTYMDFLLASSVLDGFTGEQEGDLRLDVAFNDDVNSFIRDGLAGLTVQEREGVLARLTRLYEVSTDPREREHVLYYIGRLDLPHCPTVLISSFLGEERPLLRRAAALGAILHGHAEVEESYLKRLSTSPEEQILNRSVQLVYFGDAAGDLHSFRDVGGGSWLRTRSAIFDRLALDEARAATLRWWDLVTLESLFDSRSDCPTVSERTVIEHVRTRHAAGDGARDRGICQTADAILQRQP